MLAYLMFALKQIAADKKFATEFKLQLNYILAYTTVLHDVVQSASMHFVCRICV